MFTINKHVYEYNSFCKEKFQLFQKKNTYVLITLSVDREVNIN